ncbi:hypothetical protein [Engelhardtia mirabilis]|uniref:Uncharacterized protein n=1 Tax=Engelhardtia mirabilis TaxID=2528011 RepID=A0A518BH22_9BACT|nr:hypothetical protein Pla133_13480 [Planctomycetes bacterium Pla133]QDV00607.1 hypothetical protein Pla86_13470 [Planctomycetes bacterium Pla86]
MFDRVQVPDALVGDLPFDDPELVEALGLALTDVALSDAGVVVLEQGDGTVAVGWPATSLEVLGRKLLDAMRRRGLEASDRTVADESSN